MKLISLILTMLALALPVGAQTRSAGTQGQGIQPSDRSPFLDSLGGTAAGKNLFQLPSSGGVRYLRINGDNTVSQLDAAAFLTAIGGSTGGGGGGSWGSITGTLANQTDLKNALDAKAVLPSQAGHAGKFLTTNGAATSWAVPAGGGSGGGSVSNAEVNAAIAANPAATRMASMGDWANVKAYGAKGDEVTDDTLAIQAAMDSGLPTYIPPGKYKISSALKLKRIGQQLFGAGPDITFIQTSLNNHNAIEFQALGVDVRDVYIGDMTILGPGYASSAGQLNHGVYLHDPLLTLTMISAYNSINRVHIGGFDVGLYAHQNPGLVMRESMLCGNNLACDLPHTDHWIFINCNIHAWGTMGSSYYNNPGGTLLRMRNALPGSSNPGQGFSGIFMQGELTRCARALHISGGNFLMVGGNMEGACAYTLDGGATRPEIGDESIFMEGTCSVTLDSVRHGADVSGTGAVNGTTIKWAKRAMVRMDCSAGVPLVQIRGTFAPPADWDHVAAFGGNAHFAKVSNFTGRSVTLSRYGAGVNSALHSKHKALLDWMRPADVIATIPNTPGTLNNYNSEVSHIVQSAASTADQRLMFSILRGNGVVQRMDMLNDHLIEVLATKEGSDGNVGASPTNVDAINPVPAYLLTKDNRNIGERIVMEFYGKTAANANAKTIAVRLNGTSVVTFAPTTASLKMWHLRVMVQNLGQTNNCRVMATLQVGNEVQTEANLQTAVDWTVDTNSLGLALTGTADNDIVISSTRVQFERSARKY